MRIHFMRFAIVTTVALVVGACSGNAKSPAETQTGSAGDQSRGPRQGAAGASCRDLPSVDDLKKWLRQAPSEGGEAGGLFSGKMEWATLVNRQGGICSNALPTHQPPSAW